jgi:hypothetical protein
LKKRKRRRTTAILTRRLMQTAILGEIDRDVDPAPGAAVEADDIL